ncbi:PREDICTED: oxysterol-binding protein-related protein 2 [Ceratosolen solmsi marchali]|uniref:Oxysterol-binding protein n=1 Tax=Ceratosolen solmsi marchali TaxID=326594 RepID=A0AAJ6YFV1_9HYME|nr:PREDICTED: oxysterol-binding protein-related protein 2 [Ceratosolen solmsi marchali]
MAANTVHRTSLPVPGHSEVNIGSLLSLGKDFSKITTPVIFNEPLSFLQRIAEYMEYAKLLRLASLETCPIARLQYISAFAVSGLASNWKRFGKPFNPLLGETYELQRNDFRIICEQVSHHPPISAFHAENEDYVFHGNIHPKLKFCGKTIEIHPKGMVTVILLKWNETYTWQNVNCILHNFLVGQIWMEQQGILEIKQHGGINLKAELCLKTAGWNNKDLHRVEGFIVDQNGKQLSYLYGKWTEYLRASTASLYEEMIERTKQKSKSSQNSLGHKKVLAKLNSLKVGTFKPLHQIAVDESDDYHCMKECTTDDLFESMILWEVTPRPSNCAEYFQFTAFAMTLNEIEQGMKENLCPTDSRLRPDIRKLENGDQDGAATRKVRLEEKQRDRCKIRNKKKVSSEWIPRWFEKRVNLYTGFNNWTYLGNYWDRNYDGIEDIF